MQVVFRAVYPFAISARSIASSRMRHEASISSSVIVSGGAMRSAVGQKRNHSVSRPGLHGALYDPLAERRVAEFDGHQ